MKNSVDPESRNGVVIGTLRSMPWWIQAPYGMLSILAFLVLMQPIIDAGILMSSLVLKIAGMIALHELAHYLVLRKQGVFAEIMFGRNVMVKTGPYVMTPGKFLLHVSAPLLIVAMLGLIGVFDAAMYGGAAWRANLPMI